MPDVQYDKYDPENDEAWRKILAHQHWTPLALLPTEPRCQVCRVPFAGVGGVIGKLMGFKPWKKNPSLCNRCTTSMPAGGIEIDTVVLFADIRGSTRLAEELGHIKFAKLLNHFYKVSTMALVPRRALIDKMIGDEVMALFFPLAGAAYRRASVEAAIELHRAVSSTEWGDVTPGVGIGLYAGDAWVGRISETDENEFTALGDTVNVAARLQAEAAPGQLVLSEELYELAEDLLPNAEQKTLTVRGRSEPVAVRVASIS
jgi:adenylate cyclase